MVSVISGVSSISDTVISVYPNLLSDFPHIGVTWHYSFNAHYSHVCYTVSRQEVEVVCHSFMISSNWSSLEMTHRCFMFGKSFAEGTPCLAYVVPIPAFGTKDFVDDSTSITVYGIVDGPSLSCPRTTMLCCPDTVPATLATSSTGSVSIWCPWWSPISINFSPNQLIS